jgi:Xaa-Pro aminopeptidase
MKSDLPKLMERENIDAIWVSGTGSNNPPMVYLTGGAPLGESNLILIKGKEPVLFCRSMERDVASNTGLETIVIEKYRLDLLLKETGGNENKAKALLRKAMLDELGFTKGRIALYGKSELSVQFGILDELGDLLPEIHFIGEGTKSILLKARATKDENEIKRIRKMGEITTEVVRKTAEYLQSCPVGVDEILLDPNGKPIRVADVKSKINTWLTELGAEAPREPIFALGHDAGVPHSVGNPMDKVCLGKTIIFDIFPQEAGGGYFFDFTRTWCLGYAPEAEQKLFEDVKSVFDTIMSELMVNGYCPDFQDRTCELFEALGHKTVRQDYQLESGYVHSLAHGLGLDVHERPIFGAEAGKDDILAPGSVVTIEPGLYYPELGMGCRIEDPVWVKPDGEMEILVEFPYDLVLPMKHWKG